MVIEEIDFINCCPHEISITAEDGKTYKIPQSDLLRVRTSFGYGKIGPFMDAWVQHQYIEELPPQKENTVYIISRPTAAVLKEAQIERNDFRVLWKGKTGLNEGLVKF